MVTFKSMVEQGTIADLPLKRSKKVYFVREENGGLADHGWITVDEARRKNSLDRRQFGTFQNRYFVDQPSAEGYIQTVQSGAGGFEEEPPELPGGAPLGPEGEVGPGPGAPEGPPPEPGGGLPDLPGEGEDDLTGGLGGLPGEEEPGEVPPDEMGGELDLPEEEEDGVLELIVPRRLRLTTEAKHAPKPPWERHPKSAETTTETRQCAHCRSPQTFTDDVCQHCHTYSAKPVKQGESLGEARPGTQSIAMKCPKCGETWASTHRYSAGKWWPENDDDENCPSCGEKGERGEQVPRGRKPFESQTTESGILEALLDGGISTHNALDHLTEIPDYYTLLKKMENSATKTKPKSKGQPPKKTEEAGMREAETTQQGLVQALLAGDIDTKEFFDMAEKLPGTEQAEPEIDEGAAYTCPRCGEVGVVPSAEGKCPHCGYQLAQAGGKARPGVGARGQGMGRGLGLGRGPGPMGMPSRVSQGPAQSFMGAESLESFESMVSEACKTPGMKIRSKGKGRGLARGKGKGPIGVPVGAKKKESLQEYAAPEWREVAMWARGQEVKRNSETCPYHFQEDKMYSGRKQIAVRNLAEKKAKVLSPKVLDGYSGRHSVLAQHGLRSCGYAVEVVEKL